VTKIVDEAPGTATLEAEISYWHNDAHYFHAHPLSIEVSSEGKKLRKRNGDYDSTTGAIISLVQDDGRGTPVRSGIKWDNFGNLKEIRDARGAYVRYFYDEKYQQFLSEVERGGNGAGPYTSNIEWNYLLGAKKKEKDENDEVIQYDYDTYGRLTSVQSPYDIPGRPAVKYEYGKTAGGNFYAVTFNKVSFAQDDEAAIRTVIVIDGLGRAIITGKEAEVRIDGRDMTGWAIAGGVSYDKKGRAAAQGQGEFAEGEALDVILNYNFVLKPGKFGLKRPAVIEYDTLDRQIKVTIPDSSLPDGAVETTAYAIEGNNSIVTSRDPLGNHTVQKSDSRGNIIEVERRNKDWLLQNRAMIHDSVFKAARSCRLF
jgi:hypothetical protein